LFCNFLNTAQLSQSVKGCLDKIVRIMRSKAFGEDILHTGSLENCSDRTTGYNSCTR